MLLSNRYIYHHRTSHVHFVMTSVLFSLWIAISVNSLEMSTSETCAKQPYLLRVTTSRRGPASWSLKLAEEFSEIFKVATICME